MEKILACGAKVVPSVTLILHVCLYKLPGKNTGKKRSYRVPTGRVGRGGGGGGGGGGAGRGVAVAVV